uniref:Uncharacterized protein n=1 Tax=Oryza sativa subsp. japonica TaxID=39947 RepID=Q5Z4Q2_ORYSJ|nr:hypothetical protein [Oryza sativa Japonica Group]BAD62280.1 hypothetical protein [Oryza sativa Japonica Group]
MGPGYAKYGGVTIPSSHAALQPGPPPTPQTTRRQRGGLGVPRHPPQALVLPRPEALIQLPRGEGNEWGGDLGRTAINAWRPNRPSPHLMRRDQTMTGLSPVTSDRTGGSAPTFYPVHGGVGAEGMTRVSPVSGGGRRWALLEDG